MSEEEQKSSIAGSLIRRVLFIALVTALTFSNLGLQFNGLSNPRAIEQAQTGREIARGNGFATKVLYPIAIQKAPAGNSGLSPLQAASHDTFNSPLNPFILSLTMKMAGISSEPDPEKWKISLDNNIYKLDRIVAATSTLFFLIAIGLNYLLASRIFDTRIGSVVVILMILCDLMWQFSLSGLPQMLMLTLFTAGLLNAYAATENSNMGRPTTLNAFLASLFFALLPLTHWLATWILIGFIIYSIMFIRPRGLTALLSFFLFAAFAGTFIAANIKYTGTPTGTSLYTLYDKLAGNQEVVYRSTEIPFINLKSLFMNTLATTFEQVDDFIKNTGSIIAVPIFFLALLHPFKKPSISAFRWGIAICWLFVAFGMSLYGLDKNNAIHSNQIHILFAPIMSAYGLAYASIIWSKVNLPSEMPGGRNLHFIIIIIFSAGSFIIQTPLGIVDALTAQKENRTRPNLSYFINTRLTEKISENDIVVSDQPWSVAWYGDRKCIWLPYKINDLEKFEGMADDLQTPIKGVLITDYSIKDTVNESYFRYRDFTSLALDGWARVTTGMNNPRILSNQNNALGSFTANFSEVEPFRLSTLHYRK